MFKTFVFLGTYQHIFTDHLLQPKSDVALPLKHAQELWPFFVLFGVFILFIYLYINNYKQGLNLFQSFFSINATHDLQRDEYRLNKGISIVLLVVFLLTISLFLFALNSYYQIVKYTFHPVLFYLIICGFTLIGYTLKIIFNWILGRIINSQNIIYDHIFNVLITNKAIGVFLFPVLVFFFFTDISQNTIIVSGLIVLALFYLFRVFRGVLLCFNEGGVSLFHLILYLCALEILPLAIVSKFILNFSK